MTAPPVIIIQKRKENIEMNYHNKYNKDLNEETEKNFTLPQNNDTIKLQKGVTKLGNTVKNNFYRDKRGSLYRILYSE